MINCYVEYDKVLSDLSYPKDKGYKYVLQLDKKWVEIALIGTYGVSKIGNKYVVVLITHIGTKIAVVNHDDKYYVINYKFAK